MQRWQTMDEVAEQVKLLEDKVANLVSIIESLASIASLNQDDTTSLKINEILSKFNQN